MHVGWASRAGSQRWRRYLFSVVACKQLAGVWPGDCRYCSCRGAASNGYLSRRLAARGM